MKLLFVFASHKSVRVLKHSNIQKVCKKCAKSVQKSVQDLEHFLYTGMLTTPPSRVSSDLSPILRVRFSAACLTFRGRVSRPAIGQANKPVKEVASDSSRALNAPGLCLFRLEGRFG